MLEQRLGYKFNDSDLLEMAIIRTAAVEESLATSTKHDLTFSRLKFIGSHVLSLLISDLLFATDLFDSEGGLTVAHSHIMSHNGLIIKAAKQIGLGDSLILGRGERLNAIQKNDKVLFAHVQALFGAIWIDCQSDYSIILEVLLNALEISAVTRINKRLIDVPTGLISLSKFNHLQVMFGHVFNDNNLLLNALIRQSALEEGLIDARTSFQTLEFLGDKVFGCIIAEWLMSKLNDVDSDILTPLFNEFVCNTQLLPTVAKSINLGENLIIGVGEEKVGVRLNQHRLADHMEATIAAFWLDVSQDYKKAKECIVKLFQIELEKLLNKKCDLTQPVLSDSTTFPPLSSSMNQLSEKAAEKFIHKNVKSYKEALSSKSDKLQAKRKIEQKYVFISLPFWTSQDKKGPVPIGIKPDKDKTLRDSPRITNKRFS